MTTALCRSSCSVALCLALALIPLAVRADETASAKAEYEKGQRAYSAGDFEIAADAFRESYRLQSRPAILFNLGQALRQQGNWKAAAFAFGQYIDAAGSAGKGRELAQELKADCEEKLKAAERAPHAAGMAPAGAIVEPAAGLREMKWEGKRSLCIAPVLRVRRGQPAVSDLVTESALGALSKASAAVRSVRQFEGDAPACWLEDAGCLAALGKMAGCELVLAVGVAHDEKQSHLRARLVESAKGALMGQADHIGTKEDADLLAAWVEGELCRPLQRPCGAKLLLDLDLAEMVLTVDGKATTRKPAATAAFESVAVVAAVEVVAVDAGLHKVRVGIGSRSSVEQVLALRLGASEKLLARQLADGGILLQVGSAKPGATLAASVVLETGRRWTRPTGFAIAGLGAAAGLVGVWQGSRSKGFVNDANAAYDRNGGAYLAKDFVTLQSAKSAASTANALFVVGGLLAAAGLTMALAF